jgi:glucose/arabinose dehydrogenase
MTTNSSQNSLILVLSLLCVSCSASQLPAQFDESPLPLKAEVAFPQLKWTGWSPVSDQGLPLPIRPIILTHADDKTNRIFVATQRGVLHVFPNDQQATQTKVFLNIQKKVVYIDKKNEEGLLGFAFHPNYKQNGQFFVYYTTTDAEHTSVVTRFRVSKDDPNRADPNSEVEIFRIKQPYWNHNGGTIAFGPDGYLYIALGDGGAGKDPHGNGQDLNTLLGTILRIDVDHNSHGKNYAIPKDNPFVNRGEKARPEIWAYGLRNVWRLSFDRKTGALWAGDVGQDIWEEINIITKGGNYGWNLREAKHPFGPNGSGPRSDLIDPILEYHHDVGKSITGGNVYRGKRLKKMLGGAYLYADYVSGKIWALRYNAKKKKVTANRPIPGNKMPVITFGEDEQGDTYFCIVAANGKGIYRFVPTN